MDLEIRQWMMNLYTFPIVINNITTFVDLSYMTTSFEPKNQNVLQLPNVLSHCIRYNL